MISALEPHEARPRPERASPGRLARIGLAMARHRRVIVGLQWLVVLLYAVLVTVPAFLPLPEEHAHVWDNFTRFAQFVFWGVWWPFVMVSVMMLGRVWCGVFCPEGTLTEAASRRGLGRTIPRWMRWEGWPFVAFASTTVYGQLVSVYEYPQAALLVLGGSTLAAVAIGFVYGRGKRVWCRHLCPANGVFRLLARLAPLHFRTDEAAWRRAAAGTASVDCAPLVDLRHLRSAAACHACGRCAGHRDAVALASRSPNAEILATQNVSRWEIRLLVFGVLGLATGSFQWSASPWFVSLKQTAAAWLVEHDAYLLLQADAPWWLLTNYPAVNDTFTWLDGLCLLLYIGAYTAVIGGLALAGLKLAEALLKQPGFRWRLALALIPLGGISIVLGLSMLTLSHLSAEGLSLAWVPALRATLLVAAVLWTAVLLVRLIRPCTVSEPRRIAAMAAALGGVIPVVTAWCLQFYVW